MGIQLKKRIVGFLLLIGITLIIIPLFFGHSIPADELKLSAHTPHANSQSTHITVPIPPQPATTAAIATKPVEIAKVTAAPKPAVTETLEKTIAIPPVAAPVKAAVKATAPIVNPVSAPVLAATPALAPVATVHQTPPAPASTSAPVAHKPPQSPTNPPSPPVAKPVVHPVPQKIENAVAKVKHKPTEKHAKPVASGIEAWAIQLGSFSEKANVEKLSKKLKAQGFLVYTREIKTAKGSLIKVLVGPLHHAEAEQAKVRIQKEVGVQGVLIKQ
jgi:cell division septation protein DedD